LRGAMKKKDRATVWFSGLYYAELNVPPSGDGVSFHLDLLSDMRARFLGSKYVDRFVKDPGTQLARA
jgi:hypothetical protein